MKRIMAMDFQGESFELDYEDLSEVQEELTEWRWLRLKFEGGSEKGAINPWYMYAIYETEE